jgi:hypothetical protein
LLAVIGKFYAEPLWAQARAALVKNIDERGRVPFQATGACSAPSFPGSCDVIFSAVPSGKRLVIEHVNVDIDSKQSASARLWFSFRTLPAEPRLCYPLFCGPARYMAPMKPC